MEYAITLPVFFDKYLLELIFDCHCEIRVSAFLYCIIIKYFYMYE